MATVSGDGIFGDLGFILFSTSVLNAILEYALIALLLHTMSREHQKVWFT